ncbi:hypothetical protein [Streptomyces canus]
MDTVLDPVSRERFPDSLRAPAMHDGQQPPTDIEQLKALVTAA